jgi:hypothetical protein
MKYLLVSASFAFSMVGTVSGSTSHDSLPARLADAGTTAAGDYAGSWKSSGESGGQLRLSLKRVADQWTGTASFTFEGGEVPAKVSSVTVTDSKVDVVLDWEVQGTFGQSKLTGTLSGSKIDGSYTSDAGGEQTAGTWNVVRT